MKPDLKTARKKSSENRCAALQTWLQTSPAFSRRLMLMASGIAVLLPATRYSSPADASPKNDETILQPKTRDEMAFMRRAFEMRQKAIDYGDQAYGAVIVRDKFIVGQSWSRVVLDRDPTGHAEMSAIRDAARRLKSRDLSGAVMYSSSRPCPMCEAAAYWAGVAELVYGRGATSAGSPMLCR